VIALATIADLTSNTITATNITFTCRAATAEGSHRETGGSTVTARG
jgi:hypothetical protein